MSIKVTERDLRHGSSDDRFAVAMLRCRNSSGNCSSEGRCIYGDCFATGAEAAAARLIETLIPGEDGGDYVAYLRKAAYMLRNGLINL